VVRINKYHPRKGRPEKTDRLVPLSLSVTISVKEILEKMASQEKMPIAMVARRMIDKGLSMEDTQCSG
jgi:hypothetical protein